MGYSQKIKCKNCGYEDRIFHTEDIIEKSGKITWGRTNLISKKREYTTHIKNNELYKYANKDTSDLVLNFKVGDIKCPKCNLKKFEIINQIET